jgi:hypothetical protein
MCFVRELETGQVFVNARVVSDPRVRLLAG